MKNQYNIPCNIAQTLNIIGDKWTLLIIHEILLGACTYKEIHEKLEGIPTNLLSERLKNLEKDGLITLVLYQKHPPRYEYILTEASKDLTDVFHSLILWGEKYVKKCKKQLMHIECGHKVEQKYYCPHCGRVVEKEELHVD